MDPFSQNVDLKEEFNTSEDIDNSNSFLPKNKIKLFIVFIFLVILTIGLLILIFQVLDKKSTSKSDEKHNPPEKNMTISGEIICIYSIGDINSKTPLLSQEFENKNTINDIYIDDNKIDYCTEYKFSTTGRHTIKYILNSEIILDNMFKDIQNIKSIESMNVYPDSKVKILSMISTFEGCSSLKSLSLNDTFNTMELKSVSKLFNNSGIKELNINNFDTQNV